MKEKRWKLRLKVWKEKEKKSEFEIVLVRWEIKNRIKTVFLIYGKERDRVILLTACLKESRSESRTTSFGNLFHKTMDIGKKENW